MKDHSASPRILVIRRDNIGDLVCTTPVFRALRARFPRALICALVNSYNLPVLENNSDIDQAFAYMKAKHRPRGKSLLSVYWGKLRLMLQLRRMRFDHVILAGPGLQERSLNFARMIGARHIVGFTDEAKSGSRLVDIGVTYRPVPPRAHEVEDTFRLLSALGIAGTPPPLRIEVSPAMQAAAHDQLRRHGHAGAGPVIGVHISARKPSQRWPVARFTDLITRLRRDGATVLLFWSPGDASNPLHPGDDAKAKEIMDAVNDPGLIPRPTQELGELIAGLSLCERVICSDGGAMHIAAGLGKPIACFFGKSEAHRWHPWGVPYVVLQKDSLEVSDISVDEAWAAFKTLRPS